MTTTHLQTKLEIKSWDENPFHELPDGQKVARATTMLVGSELSLQGAAMMSSLLHYLADGTSTFVAVLSIEGRLGDRSGSVVLHGTGSYDGTHARMELTIVPGSGTGELAGIRGGGASVSSHGDYPLMPLTLDYELA
jgi:Protein of unknown function (DUF3224)